MRGGEASDGVRNATMFMSNDPLQFGPARAAIGAGLQGGADRVHVTGTGFDGVADRGHADAEAGADERTAVSDTVRRASGQEKAARMAIDRFSGEERFHRVPMRRGFLRPDEQTGVEPLVRERRDAKNTARSSTYSAISAPGAKDRAACSRHFAGASFVAMR